MSDEGVLFNGCWICRRTKDELDGLRVRIFSHATDELTKLKRKRPDLRIEDPEEQARDLGDVFRLTDADELEFMLLDYAMEGQLWICGVCQQLIGAIALGSAKIVVNDCRDSTDENDVE